MTNYDILKEYEAHKTPVPSYTKYENIITENTSLKQIRDELDCAITQLREDKIDLEEENEQLKELLKECKKMLMSSNYQNMTQYHEVLDIRDKIDEVLGEK